MSLIICELGHNHNGDMKMMAEMIDTAKDCGADIAKFQLYEISKILPPDHKWYWDLERGQLSREQWLEVVDLCKQAGIEFLASVFDVERVAWCEEVGVNRYKIASRSIYEKELIDAVISTGKPIIASLGMYHEPEFPSFKADFLYCVAKYPTLPEDINFNSVDFKKYAGFSDHTLGIEAALVAMARGARIIEKHFTLDKTMDGADHSGSMTPDELRSLVEYSKKFEALLR